MDRLFSPPRLVGKYISSVLRSGWLTTGPMCEKLKGSLGDFLNCRPENLALFNSATSAFQAIVDLLDAEFRIHNLDLYLTPSTWPGLHQIVDRSKFYRWTRETAPDGPWVKVVTDIGGAMLIDEELPEGKILIHDACHSWAPMLTARFSFMSLYPTKLVPGAEGGVVRCQSEPDARLLEEWGYCGLKPGAAGKGALPTVPGRKANMTDVQAALNLEALELAPAYMEGLRLSHFEYVRQALNAGLPCRRPYFRPYLFQLEVPADKVPEFRARMGEQGVATAWNFRPAGLVTLPMYPDMSPSAQALVLLVVEKVWDAMGLVRGSCPPAPIPRPPSH